MLRNLLLRNLLLKLLVKNLLMNSGLILTLKKLLLKKVNTRLLKVKNKNLYLGMFGLMNLLRKKQILLTVKTLRRNRTLQTKKKNLLLMVL